jgi:quercetin dioxygenase-like cupin family protein
MAQPHTTTGTARRPGHLVSGQGLTYHLPDEIEGLWHDLPRTSGRRSAKTLAKSANLRVALVALDAGTTMHPKAAAGGASLHVLQGRLKVHADGHVREVQPGELVVLSRNLRERVEALERSAFLTMVAWPNGAGAWAIEAASGRL